MNIKKYGLMLTSKSQLVAMYRDDNLYGLLAEKLTTDYFELLRISEYIQQVIENKIGSLEINTRNFGYFKIGPINAILILENHYSDDFPDYMIRGYIPSLDVLNIVNSVIDHIEKNNWNRYRKKLKNLYDKISDFRIEGYELSLKKREKSFFVDFNTIGKHISTNLVQNYLDDKSEQVIITSNFYWSREVKFVWNISEVERFFEFLEKGISNLNLK